MNTKDEVVEWLVDWFVQHGRFNQRIESTTTNYLETGWLDSLGIIELLTDVENQFGFRFNEDLLSDPRFQTVDGLGELISEQSAQLRRGPRAQSQQ